MNRRDIRWLLVWSANLLLLTLTALGNHYLAPFAVHLYVAGLCTVFAALRLDQRHGFIVTALTGLSLDAMTPLPFGTHIVLLGLVYATLLYGRGRFPRDEPIFATVVALLTNLFLFLTLSFFQIHNAPRPGEAWLRLFVDLICSQVVIGLITPWFMALQAELLALAKLHPETGKRTDL